MHLQVSTGIWHFTNKNFKFFQRINHKSDNEDGIDLSVHKTQQENLKKKEKIQAKILTTAFHADIKE